MRSSRSRTGFILTGLLHASGAFLIGIVLLSMRVCSAPTPRLLIKYSSSAPGICIAGTIMATATIIMIL